MKGLSWYELSYGKGLKEKKNKKGGKRNEK